MSFLNLIHTDATRGTQDPFDLQVWFKKAGKAAVLDEQSLSSVAVITGYLLATAALCLTAITGGFPWFMLMLIVFSPLYTLMADEDKVH